MNKLQQQLDQAMALIKSLQQQAKGAATPPPGGANKTNAPSSAAKTPKSNAKTPASSAKTSSSATPGSAETEADHTRDVTICVLHPHGPLTRCCDLEGHYPE